ncbi:hypothetical protein [Sphingomonas sp. TZW2008]|uniref:hypothetical protein n=1 Tax=Sphingomonas sp. TZW2008 TaxID=1917973 RepID=UPI000A267C34|nr:hypothetical protein [Sphingomonas sp. TZW2008]
MDLNKPHDSLTLVEQQELAVRLARSKEYGSPRRVWVEDGHVFVEGHDGEIMSMMPDVAIKMGRMLEEAGTDSLINRVMDDSRKLAEPDHNLRDND